jgi:pimeloyl-ACP methyl ester carboxylesterase
MAPATNNPAGAHAAVNGISLYYEIHGTGKPLIMLHGGFGAFEMFAALSSTLAEKYQVIGVDLYGHGRTALTDRPIGFEDMADDIAGLVGQLGLGKAALLGFSLGGAVALQTCGGYLGHPFVKWMVLLLIASFFLQLSFFTDEGVQEHVAYLHAFSKSHPLAQRRWQRESLFQALQKQHGGTQYAISSGSSASLLNCSGHSSVLVVQPT